MMGEGPRDSDALDLFSPPPRLKGYMYGAQEARDSNRLLAIRLETNKSCNLRCRYCYAESTEDLVKIANYLLKAGFSKPSGHGELRLGVSFVSNKTNFDPLKALRIEYQQCFK